MTRKRFQPGDAIEFCPVSCRDTSLVKWRTGEYVGSDQSRGWHRVKTDAFGTIELLPLRRIRERSP